MNIVQGFGTSLLGVTVQALSLYGWVIIARALVSWVSPDPRNPIVRFLHLATEPVLRPLRRLLPPHRTGGLDLSPILALLALEFVKNGLLASFGYPSRFLF